jgi:DNA-directed RNA polymerase subunit F
LTIFLVLPIGHLKAKFRRAKDMDEVNEAKELLREMAEEGKPLDYDQQLEYDAIIQMTQEMKWSKYRKSVGNGSAPSIPDDGNEVDKEEFEEAVEELYYHLQKFKRRFRIGFITETIVAIVALILFILTEDMRLPMVLIDMWTPAMIILLAVTWIIDVRFVRYRDDVIGRDEEELEKLQDELLDARERARTMANSLVEKTESLPSAAAFAMPIREEG